MDWVKEINVVSDLSSFAQIITISNTIFKHHPSTWTSPSGLYKNQIDYTLIRTRWRTSVTNIVARPGAICGSDYKLLKSSLTIKLKTLTLFKSSQRLPIPDEKVFQETLRTSGPALTEGNSNQTWEAIKTWIVSGVNKTTNPKPIKKKHWMTERTIDLIDSRRRLIQSKTITPENKKALDKEIQKSCKNDKNQHIARVCQELEEHANKNRSHELYDTVKYLSR